jgi:hypothetical protein
MSMIVIMPGGFHPFHAGHASLYQSALKAFPNADVYVAATNDTKTRPFPFEIKEKLAKVAGVQDGRFVQVKSPFQAKEILQNYNPEEDVVVFVRSEKDRDEQPKPGGTKKDGSPAYFQPYTGKDMQPFSKHGYMAYLPTVEFGPGIKSATEIRNIWPKLDDRRKLAMVMSLYPKAKENQRLAQNIVKMLDLGMGTEDEAQINEFVRDEEPKREPRREQPITIYIHSILHNKTITIVGEKLKRIPYGKYDQVEVEFTVPNSGKTRKIWMPVTDKKYPTGKLSDSVYVKKTEMNDNIVSDGVFEYWAYEPASEGFTEGNEVNITEKNAEDKTDGPFSDLEASYRHPDTNKILQFARQHYPEQPDLQGAFVKFVLRSLKHSEEDSERHEDEIENLNKRVDSIEDTIKDLHSTQKNQKVNENFDYIEEK